MKITGIHTYKFSVPAGEERRDPYTGGPIASTEKSWLFLKIETDGGIAGWGEGTGEWLVEPVEAALHQWEPLLVGQDPLRVAALTDDLSDRSPWKGGPILGTAAAAVNMALYDIAGKAWGVPVHVILGGKRRDRVRVYGNGGLDFESPDKAVASAKQRRQMGYLAGKGNPLETRRWPMDPQAIEQSVACVAAVRQAMGPEFQIMLDTHGSPTPELSLEFARRVAPHHPLFLEEPVKVGCVEALLAVSRASPVPIATGEKIFTLAGFKELIDRRACAFLQPDIAHCFGITQMMAIAKLAEMAQMLMSPHNVGGPLYHGATLNAVAAMPNFLIQEITDVWFEQYHRYADHDWVIRDGYMNVSDRPGLGVEIKEQDIAKLPYQPMTYRQYRHEDGSWKGW
jgi:galactonate dehydratase